MAYQPIRDNIVEPLIPKNDDFTIFTFTKCAIWFISLTAAITSHHSFKSINYYKHFNLQRFDHETLIPIAIILLHAFSAFITRFKFLVDMKGVMEAQLQLQGMLLVVLNEQLLNDDAMIMTTTMFSIFLLCFFRSVAPGFGWKLPTKPLTVDAMVAYHVYRLLEFVPIFITIFLFFVLPEYDERHVGG